MLSLSLILNFGILTLNSNLLVFLFLMRTTNNRIGPKDRGIIDKLITQHHEVKVSVFVRNEINRNRSDTATATGSLVILSSQYYYPHHIIV